MELLASIGRLFGIAALYLGRRGEGGAIVSVLRFASKSISIFGDDKAKLDAFNDYLEQKVRDQENFTIEEFDALYAQQDALTGRADDAARDRELDTSSEGSPVGDLKVDDAVAAIADLGAGDEDALRAIVEHDGRKGARDAAQAKLEELIDAGS